MFIANLIKVVQAGSFGDQTVSKLSCIVFGQEGLGASKILLMVEQECIRERDAFDCCITGSCLQF